MSEQGWRAWFPKPIGTHWCWFETVQVSIAVGGFIAFVVVIAFHYLFEISAP